MSRTKNPQLPSLRPRATSNRGTNPTLPAFTAGTSGRGHPHTWRPQGRAPQRSTCWASISRQICTTNTSGPLKPCGTHLSATTPSSGRLRGRRRAEARARQHLGAPPGCRIAGSTKSNTTPLHILTTPKRSSTHTHEIAPAARSRLTSSSQLIMCCDWAPRSWLAFANTSAQHGSELANPCTAQPMDPQQRTAKDTRRRGHSQHELCNPVPHVRRCTV